MKICMIVDDYMPNSIKVAAKMMHELACEYVNQGHEVTVVTPSSQIKTKYEIINLDGVTVCNFKSGKIKNVNKIKRAINETLLSYYAWTNLNSFFKKNKHDLIIYYSPTIFWGSLVMKLKKLWDAPSYLILRDIFPQWAVDQGLIKKKSLIDKYFRYFEKKNYAAADVKGLMSQKNLEWFNNYCQKNIQVEVLHNWASNVPVDVQKSFKKSLGLEGKIVYFYGGNIGHAQDMMNLVRLVINFKNEKDAHFVFVGEGDEVELVKKAIIDYDLKNLTLLPPVNQEDFKQMLAEFDIGLFSLHKDHSTHNFPGKILGYIVQELPVLGSINKGNDLKDIIDNTNAGLITLNGDDDTLFNNAKALLSDAEYRKLLGKNARKLLETTFSVEVVAKQIPKSLAKVHSNREVLAYSFS